MERRSLGEGEHKVGGGKDGEINNREKIKSKFFVS